MVPFAAGVGLAGQVSLVTPAAVFAIFLTGGGLLGIWLLRERRVSRQRETLRGIMRLTEAVTSASSPVETAQRLEAVPEELFGTTDIALYLHHAEKGTLDRVVTQPGRQAESISVNLPSGSVPALLVAAFRNRTMLAVPDVRRSPFVDSQQPGLPESAVLVAMIAQGEVLGVLSLLYQRHTDLNPGFLAAVQHLANQAAAALRLQGQQLMKEQLLRSEKMAAAGQMIASVASGLRVPLLNISRVSGQLISRTDEAVGAELREILTESERGLKLVAHLVSFSDMERRVPKVFDACALVMRLLESRAADHIRQGIEVEQRITDASTEVLADPRQMEHALLSALVLAERVAAGSPGRKLVVACEIAGSRTQISFETATAANVPVPEPESFAGDVFGFPVAHAILQSHGGDLRRVAREPRQFRIEADIPLHAPSATTGEVVRRAERPARVITALIVEPELVSQRRLVALLSARGHRAIPVSAADEASDMAQRVSFDVMFCSTDVQGLTWVELFQRVRRKIGVFTLLTDGVDPASIQAFSGGEGHVLAKPVAERDLDHILGIVEVRWTVSRR